MQSIVSMIYFILISLLFQKPLQFLVLKYKGDLNYIHAEVLDPNSGLSE